MSRSAPAPAACCSRTGAAVSVALVAVERGPGRSDPTRSHRRPSASTNRPRPWLTCASGVMPSGHPRPITSDQLHSLSSTAVPPRMTDNANTRSPAVSRWSLLEVSNARRILRSVDHRPVPVSPHSLLAPHVRDPAYWRGADCWPCLPTRPLTFPPRWSRRFRVVSSHAAPRS